MFMETKEKVQIRQFEQKVMKSYPYPYGCPSYMPFSSMNSGVKCPSIMYAFSYISVIGKEDVLQKM